MAQAHSYATYYQQMEVQTADQFELVLILYKGTIQNLNLVKKYLASNEIEKRVLCLNKAVAMIGELQTALDFEKGGQIAQSLNRLYSYMLQKLALANARQEVAAVDEVISLMTTLQSAWEEAQVIYRQQSGPSTPEGSSRLRPSLA